MSHFYAQADVEWLREELPLDTHLIGSHSSIRPINRVVNPPRWKYKTPPKIDLFPISDSRYGDLGYLASGGIALEYKNQPRLYGRASVLGAYSDFYSDAYFADSTGQRNVDVRARLSYTPSEFFNFQAGIDKNFIGQGSRSLLISDNADASPFVQLNTSFWRINYTVWYQFLRENQGTEWRNKFSTSHHLSIKLAKWLDLGIFETVLYHPKDTLLNRGIEVEYLNPVIFYRPQEYSLGSSDNVLLGLDLRMQIKKLTFYGQLVLDEFNLNELRKKSGWWANKYGIQFGVKSHYKTSNLHHFSRVEFNTIRPYTYAHLSSDQNYGHQGLPLAHPLGANFYELLGEHKTQYNRWLIKLSASYIYRGLDTFGFSQGGNIYQPYTNRNGDYGHYTGQGKAQHLVIGQLAIHYFLLPKQQLTLFSSAGVTYITESNSSIINWTVGLRNMLWNNRN